MSSAQAVREIPLEYHCVDVIDLDRIKTKHQQAKEERVSGLVLRLDVIAGGDQRSD